jgi:hypothetical protein
MLSTTHYYVIELANTFGSNKDIVIIMGERDTDMSQMARMIEVED